MAEKFYTKWRHVYDDREPYVFEGHPNKAIFLPWSEERQRTRNQELEDQFPGITHIFHELIEMIPRKPDFEEFPLASAVIRPVIKEVVPGQPYNTMEVIVAGTNMVKTIGRATEHAEKWMIEKALEKLKVEHLPEDCILVTLFEPCMMCSGVIAQADVRTVVFGSSQDDARDREVLISGKYKKFRAAPKNYSAGEVINANRHHPEIEVVVEGGCCRNEVLARMLEAGRLDILSKELPWMDEGGAW